MKPDHFNHLMIISYISLINYQLHRFNFHFVNPFEIKEKNRKIYIYENSRYSTGNRIRVNRNFKNSHPVEG